MNDLLQLKGNFEPRNNPSKRGYNNIPAKKHILIEHIKRLANELSIILDRWNKQDLLAGALLSIQYIKVIPKSSRVQALLSSKGQTSNSSIVGAKFVGSDASPQHLITHFVGLNLLAETVKDLTLVSIALEKYFDDKVTHEDIDAINKNIIDLDINGLSKSRIVDLIVDTYHIERIFVNDKVDDLSSDSIVTIYDTANDAVILMNKLGINIPRSRTIGNHTILLSPDELSLLKQKAPYLISMATTDISQLTLESFVVKPKPPKTIPEPSTEPTIGVIDTMFDKSVYFSKWVEFKNMLDPNIPLDNDDYIHGTKVSSIIVDGPSLNPQLDDGCGRFKVRHFGVASGGSFSSFTILKLIQQIITANKDIKVWNLSLGSNLEINKNSISPEAAILDEIQYENDVIFVIAGTNNRTPNITRKIGAPADSINSLVVNSVDFNNRPASYTRNGPVLSFFNKPDVGYYGGDENGLLTVYTPIGEALASGTSFAAPWISRKMAYLINKLGLSRELAKALLIDSASGWIRKKQLLFQIGYGVVPIRIEDIVKSKNDEIRFVISGTAEKYITYNHSLPVPKNNGSYPYIARATLCYFPHCCRNQGVDYTSTELSVQFGRVGEKREIESINENVQDELDGYVVEKNARENFRKWDNIKHIHEYFTDRKKEKRAYANKMWGIKVTKKERDEEPFGKGINFGVVVTLKEIKGVNRIEDFINQCSLKGWLVNRINVEQRINIYNVAEEDIVFTDGKNQN